MSAEQDSTAMARNHPVEPVRSGTMTVWRGLAVATMLGLMTVTLAACDDGPDDEASEAGAAIDDAADEAGEAAENAGDAIEDTAEDAADAVGDAAEDAGDAVERTTE